VVPTALRRMAEADPERLIALKKSTGEVSITAVETRGFSAPGGGVWIDAFLRESFNVTGEDL
jgi:hypothetical protein